MKKKITIAIAAIFALAACETTNTNVDPVKSEATEMKAAESVECVPTPEDPQCGEGGGPGPILGNMSDSDVPEEECVPTPENPQCGEGGGPGPILGNGSE